MACMEHECCECGTIWFDNKRYGTCPKCGSSSVSDTFDEPLSDFADEDPYADEYDDDEDDDES